MLCAYHLITSDVVDVTWTDPDHLLLPARIIGDTSARSIFHCRLRCFDARSPTFGTTGRGRGEGGKGKGRRGGGARLGYWTHGLNGNYPGLGPHPIEPWLCRLIRHKIERVDQMLPQGRL